MTSDIIFNHEYTSSDQEPNLILVVVVELVDQL